MKLETSFRTFSASEYIWVVLLLNDFALLIMRFTSLSNVVMFGYS